MRIVARLALVALVGACGSVTTYQSAETVGRGRGQGFAALGAGAYRDDPMQTRTPTVTGEVGARYGVAANTDVGLKLYAIGIEASVRQRLVDGGVSGWSWALLGAIGGVRRDLILAQAKLGIVTTRRTSTTWAWSLGTTTIGSLFVPLGGGHATGVTLGMFGGADWRFARCWHLVPEVSAHRAIVGDVPVDGTIVQLGAAVARDF
ncbi:MAG: hypothetical protein NT062_27560 [Proteobacteria bacterium]|nr:hypothetical protein [Pseudomonadota bacterium]